jgi:hypothetical protein
MNEYRADRQTSKWLTANGINPKLFASADILLLQAQKEAHQLLRLHRSLLTDEQHSTLTNYLSAMNSRNLKGRIPLRRAYAVMNIGTRIKRKLFKLNRTLIKGKNRR